MTTIKLYGPRMGSSLRSHWVAAELGTAYETVAVDFAKGENRTEAFLKISPMGQVPALVVGDFNLAESMAICSYLIDVAGSDLGGKTAEQRALAWQWSLWTALNPHPHLSKLASPMWTKQAISAEAEADAKAELARYLPVLEARLRANPFVAGSDFTVGDINVACALAYAAYSKYDMADYKAINAWQAKVTERPAYGKARG